MQDIYIAGTGLWYPKDVITNDELVHSYNTYVDIFNSKYQKEIESGSKQMMEHSSSEFIEKASGIKTRYVLDKKNILDPDVMMPLTRNEDRKSLSILAEAGVNASKKAMKNAGLTVDDIDAVIVGTSHAARNFPAVAIEIQEELGINGYAYDMLVGCSSTTFAINNAYSDIAAGTCKTILVVNPEITSPGVDFRERDRHFIFGDGCVATIVQKNSSSKNRFKILDRKLLTKFSNNIRSDFSYLNRTAIDQKTKDEVLFTQNGRSVFKEVCPMVSKFILDQLESLSLKPEDISKYWLHQANIKMVKLIASKITGKQDVDESIATLSIKQFGNLASAGSMFAFNLYNDLEIGEKGIICSFGAGYSVASILVEKC